jgi:hypothetical protein
MESVVSVQEMAENSGAAASPVRQRRPEENELIISYMFLRKTVGWIGSLLPIVLIVGNMIFFTSPRPYSMSGYYYTDMRNVFVGALCALGVFLVAYAGYDEVDRWITNLAGFCAIGVAFFPTKPSVCMVHAPTCAAPSVTHLSASQQTVGDVHVVFAAVTFVALGLMALRFAKSAPTPGDRDLMGRIRHGLGLVKTGDASRSPRKKARDAIYGASGFTILSCVALAALSNLLPTSVKANWPLLFTFEALAVFAFGLSWFVKGQTLLPILKDQSQ